tara:strand:+ start:351 stop:602 length:252 start_codon:yes stop_codon:yes gene_type:complete
METLRAEADMKLRAKQKQIVELEYQAASVETRISDLEFMIAYGNDRPTSIDSELSDRRKAYDKLKYIRREIANLSKEVIDDQT